MAMLNQMNSSELHALAAQLYAEIDRSSHRSTAKRVELRDVQRWINFRMEDAETDFDILYFANL